MSLNHIVGIIAIPLTRHRASNSGGLHGHELSVSQVLSVPNVSIRKQTVLGLGVVVSDSWSQYE
jgi:hypothetical protein